MLISVGKKAFISKKKINGSNAEMSCNKKTVLQLFNLFYRLYSAHYVLNILLCVWTMGPSEILPFPFCALFLGHRQ